MIPRYEDIQIKKFWSDEYKFEKFLLVEKALLEVLETKKIIPTGVTQAFNKVTIDTKRIDEVELVTRHDVIAFCQSITEQVDPKFSKYFHFGVTSSDIIDTAQSLILKDCLHEVSNSLQALIKSFEEKVKATSHILAMGRSHGMNAEPIIFAQKFLSFQKEFERRLQDYKLLIETELTGQISGAVGNYTVLSPEIEEAVITKLGLKVEKVSTQVIPRDHLAKIIMQGALLAVAIERCSTEIRLLHHSDLAEVSEGFKAGQKGSSTMPHKKNPVSSENLSGLARVIKSHVEIALQNCSLWHERDISHSSSERLMLPDHFGLLVYSLKRLATTIQNLEVHEKNIEDKITKNFTYLSSYLLHHMILLNDKSDIKREDIYALIQKTSFQAKNEEEFFTTLEKLAKENKILFPDKVSAKTLKDQYLENFKKIRAR